MDVMEEAARKSSVALIEVGQKLKESSASS